MAQIYLDLATKFLNKTRWKRILDRKDGLRPSGLTLADGLRRIVDRNAILKAAIEAAADVDAIDLDEIEAEIEDLQRKLGSLEIDGVLGSQTLSDFLVNTSPCTKNPQKSETRLSDETSSRIKKRLETGKAWYFYYVERTPVIVDGANADELIRDAWDSWREHVSIECQRLPEDMKDSANVIISTKDFTGSVLGEANVGRPFRKTLLRLDMDSSRKWTSDQFRGAVCHEIGHILGLRHDAGPNSLMSEFLPRGITSPQQTDIDRAVKLDWLSLQPPVERVTLDDLEDDDFPV